MRTAFIDELTKIAREDSKTALLIAEGGFSVTEKFEAEFAGRFFNMGIAEQSLISTSAGMALRGYTTVAYGMVPFLTMRCYEQIRMDVAYQDLPVIIAGIGPGMHYGSSGASHNSIEDLAIMRTMPNMNVVCASCSQDARGALRQAVKSKNPCYISLERENREYQAAYSMEDFCIGKAIQLTEGKDAAIFACGNQVISALQITKKFAEAGIYVRVYNMHTIKPLDAKSIYEAAKDCKCIFTLEERNVIGGLGSAVAEIIAENSDINVRFKRFGIRDEFQRYAGTQQWLLEQFGLTVAQVYDEMSKIIKG
nr:transketolase C-terminal domain-containing protein [uncultured Anaerosporobacter sp.]